MSLQSTAHSAAWQRMAGQGATAALTMKQAGLTLLSSAAVMSLMAGSELATSTTCSLCTQACAIRNDGTTSDNWLAPRQATINRPQQQCVPAPPTSEPMRSSSRAKGSMPRTTSAPALSTNMMTRL